MDTVLLRFHPDGSGDDLTWWADSPDLPGFSATDANLGECVRLAVEGAATMGYRCGDVCDT